MIPFDSEIMTFTPADLNNLEGENRARIELSPQFSEDGLYNLIVQARDATGNQSGEYDFPNIDDGVAGMAFIDAAVRSSEQNSAWTKLNL